MSPISEDPVIQYVVSMAQPEAWIHKIILYGSRARGDHHLRSDYDLAVFEKGPSNQENWARWAQAVREGVPTLCGLDLIQLQPDTDRGILDAISREGKIVYERK